MLPNRRINPVALQEANNVIKLQEWLVNLNENSLNFVAQHLLSSFFIQTPDRIQQLVWNIVQIVTIRPKLIPLFCQLFGILIEQASPNNALSYLRPIITKTLLTPKPFFEQFLGNVGDFIFLRQIITDLHFPLNEIVDQFKQFCMAHDDLKYYHCLLFSVFAPEIQIANPEFFKLLRNQFYDEWTAPSCKPVLKDFFDNITNLNKDNWALLKQCYILGGYPNMVAVTLKNDDIDQFQELSNHPNFSMNWRIRPSVFEPCQFLQNEPTLIQYAAFHGSLKCFKFLLLNGADLEAEDNAGMTLAHFVVAGGNTELVRLIQQRKCDFSGCLQIATRFHRFDIFDWLHFTYFHDMGEIHQKFGSVLHESAGCNNIRQLVFCIDNMLDVNSRAIDKSTPLHYAVKNRMCDSVRVLLATDGIDANAKDNTGMTPLHTAALFEDPTMAIEVLKCPKVDVSMVNSWGMTPLHLAAQDGNAETVQALLTRPEIDVNCKDENFMTPLHYAAQEGEYETVRVLLQAKSIDVRCEDSEGRIPFSYAEQSGMEETAQLLQEWENE